MPKLKPETQKLRAQDLLKLGKKHRWSPTAIAKELGISQQAVSDRFNKPYVQEELWGIMEKQGLTLQEDAADLKRLRKAKRIIGYLHQYKKNKKGELEKISPDETVSNEFIEADDNTTQLNALKLTLQLKGLLKEQLEHSGEIKGTEAKIIIVYPEGYKQKDKIEDHEKTIRPRYWHKNKERIGAKRRKDNRTHRPTNSLPQL